MPCRSAIELNFMAITHRISPLPPAERTDFILEHCRGKSVLHVGCTNFPNTAAKIQTGTLLHGRLRDVATVLHGVDVDAEGIELLTRSGFKDVFVLDVRRLNADHPVLLPAYDVVVLGDVIEHVGDPETSVAEAASRLENDGELIVSVPNAFYLFGILCMIVRRDLTSPEHVAWYSQVALIEILRRRGFRVTTIRGYYEYPTNRSLIIRTLKAMERGLHRLLPGFTSGIICCASRRRDDPFDMIEYTC